MSNNEQDNELPDYMQSYFEALGGDGYPEFVGLAKEHKQALKDYDEITYPRQLERQQQWIKMTGKNKPIDQEAARNQITQSFKDKALKVAEKHGYLEEKQEGKAAPQTPEVRPQPTPTSSEDKRQKFIEEMKIVSEKSKGQEIEH